MALIVVAILSFWLYSIVLAARFHHNTVECAKHLLLWAFPFLSVSAFTQLLAAKYFTLMFWRRPWVLLNRFTLCQGSPLLLGLDEASPWRNGAHEQQPALLVSYKYLRATIQYWRTTDILLWIDMLSDPDCPDNLLGEASLPPDTAKAFSTFVASRGLNARELARTPLIGR